MTYDVFNLAQALGVPQTTVRGWLARVDLPFAKRLGQGRSKISFDDGDAFALAVLRDLVAYGVAVRDASELAEHILTRAGAPPSEDLVAVIRGGASPVLEIVASDSMPRIDIGARLVLPLSALWHEVAAKQRANS